MKINHLTTTTVSQLERRHQDPQHMAGTCGPNLQPSQMEKKCHVNLLLLLFLFCSKTRVRERAKKKCVRFSTILWMNWLMLASFKVWFLLSWAGRATGGAKLIIGSRFWGLKKALGSASVPLPGLLWIFINCKSWRLAALTVMFVQISILISFALCEVRKGNNSRDRFWVIFDFVVVVVGDKPVCRRLLVLRGLSTNLCASCPGELPGAKKLPSW